MTDNNLDKAISDLNYILDGLGCITEGLSDAELIDLTCRKIRVLHKLVSMNINEKLLEVIMEE